MADFPPRAENVVLRIEGQDFEGWSSIEIGLAMDSFSTVQFEAPFEAERAEFREIFRPFTFKRIQVLSEQQPIFTGTIVDIEPDIDENRRKIVVTGYALPAVLCDCNPPRSSIPLEFKKLNLQQIAAELLEPFGLRMHVPPGVDVGPPFAKARIEAGEEIFQWLVNLVQQRTLVLGNTPDGELLCWKTVSTGSPRARLVGGEPPIGKIKPTFSPQEYFSDITGIGGTKKARRGTGGIWTAPNPWLRTPIRPKNFKLDDTEKGDAKAEAENKLARMFGNMAAWEASNIPTWRDPQDDLWEPNTTHLVLAPDAMIYRESELVVRKVTLMQDEGTSTAAISWMLPGAFSGDVPKELPWND